jgi:hypothetical protein
MTYTFEANGKSYKTDKITIELMREYREAGNMDMLGLILEVGLSYGKIVEL